MWAWYSRRAAWTSCTRSWLGALLSLLLLSVLLASPLELLLVPVAPVVPVVLSSWLANRVKKVCASLLLMAPVTRLLLFRLLSVKGGGGGMPPCEGPSWP